jgi:hypothetical protein
LAAKELQHDPKRSAAIIRTIGLRLWVHSRRAFGPPIARTYGAAWIALSAVTGGISRPKRA